MTQVVGKVFIFSGIIFLILGIIFYFWGHHLNFIGRLPGDIHIEKENFKFYFPFTTMIIFSILLSLLIFIVRRL